MIRQGMRHSRNSGNMTQLNQNKNCIHYLFREYFCQVTSDFQMHWWLFNNKDKTSNYPMLIHHVIIQLATGISSIYQNVLF